MALGVVIPKRIKHACFYSFLQYRAIPILSPGTAWGKSAYHSKRAGKFNFFSRISVFHVFFQFYNCCIIKSHAYQFILDYVLNDVYYN